MSNMSLFDLDELDRMISDVQVTGLCSRRFISINIGIDQTWNLQSKMQGRSKYLRDMRSILFIICSFGVMFNGPYTLYRRQKK